MNVNLLNQNVSTSTSDNEESKEPMDREEKKEDAKEEPI